MAYMAGCTCEDCGFGHRLPWLDLSEPQSALIAVLANGPLPIPALRARGFHPRTIDALQRNRPLLRRFAVIGSADYCALTPRGREVWAQAG